MLRRTVREIQEGGDARGDSRRRRAVLVKRPVIGNETAECLLNTVYFYNVKLFGLRAKAHRQLRYVNIRVENNFIVFDESVSKTFHSGLNDLKYKPRFVKYFCHALESKHIGCLVEIYICYLPDGRSVLEKYFVEVSKTARGRRPRDVFETETKYFSVRTDLNGK